ncbi:hypothetical protein VL20_3681 [Microcystis panniformis FACHB-1757]|uniref:Uncharacterized protein n=1 Tax=Microcystis panniformis FACHB-1757 TaxID=1638788 RepID=A0A0K1S3X1_9CHRO|nr:hypothetical protein VL20_3681 [Microcystis panniformis FACHB-1757]
MFSESGQENTKRLNKINYTYGRDYCKSAYPNQKIKALLV